MEIPKIVKENTLLGALRLNIIKKHIEETQDLLGDMAEVGVFRGGCSLWMKLHSNKHLFVLDTFEGMPDSLPVDHHKKGDFKNTSLQHVTELLEAYKDQVTVLQGIFPKENAEHLSNRKFSLVHIDVDIYESTKECLEFFYPRMLPGSVMVLDDYTTPTCLGAGLAIDEFFADKPHKPIITREHQAIVKID